MPNSAPGIFGSSGRPPVAMMMCGALKRAVAGSDGVRIDEMPARAHELDVALGEVRRVHPVQAVHVGVPPALELAPVMPQRPRAGSRSLAHPAAALPKSAAFHMIFFGTQPTFTQVPPRGPDSISATRAPYSAARCAAASPPLPPPITTKSNFSLIDPRDRLAAMLYEVRPARVPERGVRAAAGAATMTPFQRAGSACKTLYSARSRCRSSSQIRPEHVEPAVRELLSQNRARIEELATSQQPTFASVVEPLEELQHRISRTWSPVSHLNAVLNSDALRAGYNACLPLLSAYQTDLAQSEPLFRAYRTVAEQQGAALGPVQRQLIEHARARLPARRRGAAGRAQGALQDRDARAHAAAGEVRRERARCHQRLDAGTSRMAAQLRGLNEMLIEQARRRAARARRARLAADASISRPTSRWSRTRNPSPCGARSTKPGPRAPRTRARTPGRWDNSAVMEEILRRRHEAARLLDFNNYADYALATRMAHSVDEVLKFLHELAGTARAAAQAEFAELEAFAGRKLAAWDVGFYAERLQRERFSVSQEELRPYFPLPRVLAGLFEVAERLFGVRIHERAGAPVWHPDVRFFDIESLRGEPVGSFYLDAYARPNKRSGAWMDECVGRKRLASGRGAAGGLPRVQLPAARAASARRCSRTMTC